MSLVLIAVLALLALCLVAGAILGFAAVRFKVEGNPIAEQINALLPQTQCGQCGYPGCKPYAEAIAGGDKINKCPPGGEATIQALADLLGLPAGAKPLAVLCLGPVTEFYPAPMLALQGWAQPRPLSELLYENYWGVSQ